MIKYEVGNSCHKAIIAIQKMLTKQSSPLVVAIDGGSGCGKSTIANYIAQQLDAIVVPCDDFFGANITDEQWDSKTAIERAHDAINWKRIRSEVLIPLLAGQAAKWHAFDFEAGQLADGTYKMSSEFKTLHPASIIILDGIYSARDELSNLVNLSILVDVPIAIRHARLAKREQASFLKAWHSRWDEAEAWYLTEAKPPPSFDLLITNS